MTTETAVPIDEATLSVCMRSKLANEVAGVYAIDLHKALEVLSGLEAYEASQIDRIQQLLVDNSNQSSRLKKGLEGVMRRAKLDTLQVIPASFRKVVTSEIRLNPKHALSERYADYLRSLDDAYFAIELALHDQALSLEEYGNLTTNIRKQMRKHFDQMNGLTQEISSSQHFKAQGVLLKLFGKQPYSKKVQGPTE